MKNAPLKGDWSNIVVQDMDNIGLTFSDEETAQMSKSAFKTTVKNKMREHVLDELNAIKSGHNKVKYIVHSDLKFPQKYLLLRKLSNEQNSLLFNLRCKNQHEFSSNFSNSTQTIPGKICLKYEDTQEHALLCQKTLSLSKQSDQRITEKC